MPALGRIGVSRKIESDEDRRRLRDLLRELNPPRGVGFIVRTAGTDRTKKELSRDLAYLLRLWKGSCAVTSVQEPRVLRSGHIKPWADSNVQEKLDHFNGLLLIPNLDALFNEGLVSFQDDGRMLVSQDWRADDKRRMHITPDLHLRTVHSESCRYLEYHRDVVFEGGTSQANCRNKNCRDATHHKTHAKHSCDTT
jgi:hypothetical protein